MALTLSDYRSLVTHALSGGDPNAVYTDVNTTKDQIINDAGEHMTFLYPWSYRKRPPVVLTVVAGQDYVELPIDFGEIVSLTGDNGLTVDVIQSSAEEVQLYRSSNTTTTGSQYMAYLVQPTQNSTGELMGRPRLEIFPTGTAGDQFNLVSRAGWRRLSETTDVPNIPPQFERLLSHYVQAFARYHEDNAFDAITMVDQSSMVQRIWSQQSRQQWKFGGLRGGAVAGRTTRFNNFEMSNPPADPS